MVAEPEATVVLVVVVVAVAAPFPVVTDVPAVPAVGVVPNVLAVPAAAVVPAVPPAVEVPGTAVVADAVTTPADKYRSLMIFSGTGPWPVAKGNCNTGITFCGMDGLGTNTTSRTPGAVVPTTLNAPRSNADLVFVKVTGTSGTGTTATLGAVVVVEVVDAVVAAGVVAEAVAEVVAVLKAVAEDTDTACCVCVAETVVVAATLVVTGLGLISKLPLTYEMT